MGGLLMFSGGLLEFFLGNTFSFVVFASYGQSQLISAAEFYVKFYPNAIANIKQADSSLRKV